MPFSLRLQLIFGIFRAGNLSRLNLVQRSARKILLRGPSVTFEISSEWYFCGGLALRLGSPSYIIKKMKFPFKFVCIQIIFPQTGFAHIHKAAGGEEELAQWRRFRVNILITLAMVLFLALYAICKRKIDIHLRRRTMPEDSALECFIFSYATNWIVRQRGHSPSKRASYTFVRQRPICCVSNYFKWNEPWPRHVHTASTANSSHTTSRDRFACVNYGKRFALSSLKNQQLK